jgi:hypothetical protein
VAPRIRPRGSSCASASRCSSGAEDAERFIEEVRGDEPDVAAKLRIEEREFEDGGLN